MFKRYWVYRNEKLLGGIELTSKQVKNLSSKFKLILASGGAK